MVLQPAVKAAIERTIDSQIDVFIAFSWSTEISPYPARGYCSASSKKRARLFLDEYPFYSTVVGLVYVGFHPVLAQDMTGHFYHDVVGLHARITLVTRQPLQTRGARGKHLHFPAEAVRPDLLGVAGQLFLLAEAHLRGDVG